MTRFVIGCPAWERAWSLELWFQSVMDNVSARDTGLVFVVPSTDQHTREVINEYAGAFAWLEVQRDRNEQYDRLKRGEDDTHQTLAMARNQILQVVNGAKPEWFISWDSDLLLPPGTIEELTRADLPISTVWTWLNRQRPQTANHVNPQTNEQRMVAWQEPLAATAMAWDRPQVPIHYPAHEWDMRAGGCWRADVVLAFQMMKPAVYSSTVYQPHRLGEDIPFNWSLHRRRIPRYCWAESLGLHLYRRDQEELDLGWPGIMDLTEQVPLAAQFTEPRDPLDEALGFYPLEGVQHSESGHSGTASLTRAIGNPGLVAV